MPAWLIPLFWKYGVPLLIQILTKTGAINKAEALAAKAAVWVENNIETYEEYPQPKPSTTESNINKE